MGHIPKQTLTNWTVSLVATTFLLAMAIQFIEHHLPPLTRLIISLGFGTTWILIGVYMFSLEKRTPTLDPSDAKQLRRTIIGMFIGFGTIWIGISIYQFIT